MSTLPKGNSNEYKIQPKNARGSFIRDKKNFLKKVAIKPVCVESQQEKQFAAKYFW